MALNLPSLQIPFNDPETGAPNSQWVKFFAALTSQPAPKVTVTVTASPMTYTASSHGNVLVHGGTVSAIDLIRGRDTVHTGLTSGFIPVSYLDKVTVTYSAAPTVTFLAAGQ